MARRYIALIVRPVTKLARRREHLHVRPCVNSHRNESWMRWRPRAVPCALQGLARTSAERRALALFLSGKRFGTEKPLDLTQAGCKQPAAFNAPLSGPNWNGWSPNASNARFQDAAAAELDANRVPQLKLKWAFAYPGDVIAYGHPTVVGGRVFVGSSGRRVYSLDAATGCIHWAFTADSGVRAAISIGLWSSSNTLRSLLRRSGCEHVRRGCRDGKATLEDH